MTDKDDSKQLEEKSWWRRQPGFNPDDDIIITPYGKMTVRDFLKLREERMRKGTDDV